MDEWIAELLTKYPRIAIAGGPRTGKTTLASLVTDRPVLATDHFMDVEWSEVPFKIIEWCTPLESFCVEGVMVPRALRKGLDVDALVWLEVQVAARSKGQEAMAKGVLTILRDWQAKASPTIPILSPPPSFYSAPLNEPG